MTIRAELADGRWLEFPDGTDAAVVQATVKRVVGGAPAEPALDPLAQTAFDNWNARPRGVSRAPSRAPT